MFAGSLVFRSGLISWRGSARAVGVAGIRRVATHAHVARARAHARLARCDERLLVADNIVVSKLVVTIAVAIVRRLHESLALGLQQLGEEAASGDEHAVIAVLVIYYTIPYYTM